MKKLTALTLGCLLMINFAAIGETSSADQKWLEVVQNKVEKGERRVSTPNESRVQLIKDWAAKQGYAAKVTKVEGSYRVELSKGLVQK